MPHHPLYSELCQIVGSKYVADSDFAVWAYGRDASAQPAKPPGIVVRPNSTEEVSQIVKLANRHRTSIVPRSGGTSWGGHPPGDPGKSICVDMTRMRRILEINELNRTVTVESGITGAELEQRLLQRGLYAHTVWSPPDSVTVGGVLCGGQGGGGKMWSLVGENWRFIIGVKVVLPSGDVIETGSRTNRECTMFSRVCVGPDLTGLFIGSMGIFGIVTEVTMEVFLHQPHRKIGAVAYKYERLDDAYEALVQLGMHEPRLLSVAYVYGMGPAGKTDWHLCYLVHGHSEEEADSKLETTAKIIQDTAPPDAWQPEEALVFCTPFLLQDPRVPNYLGMWNPMEVCCPRDKTLEIYKPLAELVPKELEGWEDRVQYGGCFIYIMMHTHYISFALFHKESDFEAKERAMSIQRKVVQSGLEMGGFSSNQNKELGDFAAAMMPPAYSNWLRVLKQAVDPNNIMNPHMLLLP